MSDNTKSGDAAFERRMELYKKLGLKPTIVHKTGARVIFSSSSRIAKGDNAYEKTCK